MLEIRSNNAKDDDARHMLTGYCKVLLRDSSLQLPSPGSRLLFYTKQESIFLVSYWNLPFDDAKSGGDTGSALY